MKPKKYSLTTNKYGNLDSQPTGWVTFAEAEVTKQSKHHRIALESGRIYTYEVLRGFNGGSRHGWSPILEPIIHRDQLPLFSRLVAKSQTASRKEAKIKAKGRRIKAKLQATPEYQEQMRVRAVEARAAMRKQREEQLTEIRKLNALCEEVDLPPDKAGRLLAEGLRDIKAAHSSWLDDAYQAILDGERYDGIMKQYLSGGEPLDFFYHDLRKAIGAHRRHNHTNYDDLLEKGYTREEALIMKE